MPVYSDMVMDHFMHPRNVGEIENADGVGEVGNPVCGDMMTFYIKVKDNRLEDVKFKTFVIRQGAFLIRVMAWDDSTTYSYSRSFVRKQ